MSGHRGEIGTVQSGQAMTELLICASFILIPLFLIVPTFGKFIDMKHTTIQAARYEAWEYTVWYAEDCSRSVLSALGGGPEECPMGGFEAHDAQPFKSRDETQIESRQRFFGTRTISGVNEERPRHDVAISRRHEPDLVAELVVTQSNAGTQVRHGGDRARRGG